MASTPLRVRFAPSPTGYLHVGGARTALFNWLLARQSGGTFILRIEDTDQTRQIDHAEAKILEDLRWLGLDWDEGPQIGGAHGPYFQSQRLDIYEKHVQRLLEEGKAYYALDTPEQLEAARAEARAAKTTLRYRRPDPLPTLGQGQAARAQGRPVVVRFLMPPGDVTVQDRIRGEVRVPADELEDFVIQKSDGWPTYHLACVVDDALMDVSLVCRGQDHLSNTPKHIALQRALGFPTPQYAHLPLLFNRDGTKMGKRDKYYRIKHEVGLLQADARGGNKDALAKLNRTAAVVGGIEVLTGDPSGFDSTKLEGAARELMIALPEIDVHDFRASGYLPEALVNFLSLLGWSPGDDRERFTREEAVEAFSMDRIIKSNARFDREKLLALNTDWCARVSPERLLEAFRDFTGITGSAMSALDDATAARALDACKGFRTFRDVETKAGALFIADDQVRYDPQAVRKVLEKKGGHGYAMLERLLPGLESPATWSADALETLFSRFCDEHGAKLGDVAQPVRVAVTGGTISPAIYETLMFLGREKTLNRICNCLSQKQEDA